MQLADIAHFSPYHFHRIFRGMVGESLTHHIQRLRLERAASALIYSNQSVTDIAFDAGFETPESFSRAFKKQFGLAPRRYREESGFGFPDTAPNGLWGRAADKPFDQLSGKDQSMNLNIQIEMHELIHMAYLHHQGDYDDLEPAFDRLYERAADAAISLDDETAILMLTYDDPNITESRYLKADIGVVVPDVTPSEAGDLKAQTISAVEVCRCPFSRGVW
ncbi:helix-turn-helix domain-containing protein [Kiloniella litopenaei]|uniref:helix-turn-helix domain-containing protein n=1 Tax=Kiloniella litopenaei TaxID=1549748 RepID=UPI003BA94709